MKTTIMLTVALATAVLISKAQDKSQGKIVYEHTVNLHAGLKPDQQQFKDMIPEFSTSKEELYFNGKHTKTEHKEVEDKETEEGGTLKIKFDGGGKSCYSDGTLEGTYFLTEKDGKKLLMKPKTMAEEARKRLGINPDRKIEKSELKVGKKTKQILGFECTEIISGETTLWVTTALPFNSGPMGMTSEHGAVLGMEMGDKTKVFATSIEYIPVKIEMVTPPAGLEVK